MENPPLTLRSPNDELDLPEARFTDRILNDSQMIALAMACKEARQRIGETTPKSFSGNSDPTYLLNALSR